MKGKTSKAYLWTYGIPNEEVVYDFTINENGTHAVLLEGDSALMPEGYYTQTVPRLLRLEPHQLTLFRRAELHRFSQAIRTDPELTGMVHNLLDRLLPYDADEDSSHSSKPRNLPQPQPGHKTGLVIASDRHEIPPPARAGAGPRPHGSRRQGTSS